MLAARLQEVVFSYPKKNYFTFYFLGAPALHST
jgi:hypothetical protein